MFSGGVLAGVHAVRTSTTNRDRTTTSGERYIATPRGVIMTQTLEAGRQALERHSWEDAYRELMAADAEAPLGPDDLERLADAAWWSGHVEETIRHLERAYHGYLSSGVNIRAAAMALRVTERSLRAQEGPVMQTWLARAERLLAGEPESAVHAWYEFIIAARTTVDSDFARAIEHFDRAIELGQAHGDADVVSIATAFKGTALTRIGHIEEGLALLDESALAATSGELQAKVACDVYCLTLSTCHDMADLRRSTEWTERADRYMQAEGVTGYTGACRVHRAELKRRQGRWSEAEDEARLACDELQRFRILDVLANAYREIGEIRLGVGDLDGAEEAFAKAYEYGLDPQPGLAMLTLARGDAAEAARSLERTLNRHGDDPLSRALLLSAKVEISLTLEDLEAARQATEELEGFAADHPNPVWTATAGSARGALELAEGNLQTSIEALDRAWRRWQELDFSYDSARTRLLLGQARRAEGDETGARLELNAALTAFRKLGATRDVAVTEALLGIGGAVKPRATVQRTFMFTDIVTSTDLIGLIGDLAWADLIEWHDRSLRALFGEHGGEVVNHTGDGFFVAFDEPRAALDCAVGVQRRLRTHRVEHGFSPSIRVGVHTASASRGDGTYTGQGVHVAARIGEIAEGDQIVVSADTLSELASVAFPVSEPRTVDLKGVPGPFVVHTVDWT
jgi:class 3 adenylate cyclase